MVKIIALVLLAVLCFGIYLEYTGQIDLIHKAEEPKANYNTIQDCFNVSLTKEQRVFCMMTQMAKWEDEQGIDGR